VRFFFSLQFFYCFALSLIGIDINCQSDLKHIVYEWFHQTSLQFIEHIDLSFENLLKSLIVLDISYLDSLQSIFNIFNNSCLGNSCFFSYNSDSFLIKTSDLSISKFEEIEVVILDISSKNGAIPIASIIFLHNQSVQTSCLSNSFINIYNKKYLCHYNKYFLKSMF
jgi:hypothetical protein